VENKYKAYPGKRHDGQKKMNQGGRETGSVHKFGFRRNQKSQKRKNGEEVKLGQRLNRDNSKSKTSP